MHNFSIHEVRMDTRFWGPSGWRLLHLISFQAEEMNFEHIQTFFKNLPYVLPCKFCRASLTDYYMVDPIPTQLESFPKWLFRIHNRVNDKLREQKLLETKNPTWVSVKNTYTKMLKASCSRKQMLGWDFLFSISYTIPCKDVETSPMADAPPIEQLNTPELRNRWGVISREERIPYIQEWWDIFPQVLPFHEWRNIWNKNVPAPPPIEDGRLTFTSWLFKAEQIMCKKLSEKSPHDSFHGLCTELETFASGCGKKRSNKMKTCRATKPIARNNLTKRRQKLYRQLGGYL